MSLLSANSLFHFTNKLENILSILKNGFHPRYCDENMSLFRNLDQNIAIPMVCFCDTPLSLIKKHLKNYGGYGIGLKKNWGKHHKINPVMYCVKNSQAIINLKNGLEYLHRYNDSLLSKEPSIFIEPMLSIPEFNKFIYFLKPVDKYDEREWRFVPQDADEYVIPSRYQEKPILKRYIKELNDTHPFPNYLKFDVNDVKYLIVKREDEIDKIAQFLNKSRNFDKHDRNHLLTKLLVSSDIIKDF